MQLSSILSSLSWLSLFHLLHAQMVSWTPAMYDALAVITRFQSTMIVPAPPSELGYNGNVQAVWPGLEPLGSNAVLQMVVANEGYTVGEWYLLPFFCCTPASRLDRNHTQVYPGDKVTTIYTFDSSNNTWIFEWQLEQQEPKMGHGVSRIFSDSLVFNANTLSSEADKGPYTSVLFVVELQGNATWDFGAVTYTNIIIESNTTNLDWCTYPTITGLSKYTLPGTLRNVNNGISTCYIASLGMNSPKK